MKIITISREFGSGGRELGKRLADHLGCDYYDSEILAMVAQKSGMDPHYVESMLNDRGWREQNLTFRSTIGSAGYLHSAKVELLLQQKKVLEEIASWGRDCVIVGRNADVILREQQPFSVFVCAQTDAKVRRCVERAPAGENLSEKELLRKMKQIDKVRAETREILSCTPWSKADTYHLTINTSDWEIKELVPAVAEFAQRWFGRVK